MRILPSNLKSTAKAQTNYGKSQSVSPESTPSKQRKTKSPSKAKTQKIPNQIIPSSIGNRNQNPPYLKPLCDAVFILEPEPSSSQKLDDAVKLSNEFGKTTTSKDLKLLLDSMGYKLTEICPIKLSNYRTVIDRIIEKGKDAPGGFVVFNMCDGCETDGYPGISVLNELEKRGCKYTGSNPNFYTITTSKPVLKRLLIAQNVPTSPFVEITPETTEEEIDQLAPYPLFVKPSVSYASISISDKSIVKSAREAIEQANSVRGVSGNSDQVFVERFLAGREFTAFVTGSEKCGVTVYTVAERVFDPNLGKFQRILAFDRYWDGYDLEGNAPEKPQTLYWYAEAQSDMQPKLMDIAKRAFLAVGGCGYGRVDMRSTDMSPESDVFVLEVNANCGISFNFAEFTSTVGEIMRMAKEPNSKFANDLIQFALNRT